MVQWNRQNLERLVVGISFLIPYMLDRFVKSLTYNITDEPVYSGIWAVFYSFSKLGDEATLVEASVTSSIVASLFVVFSIFIFALLNYVFTYKHLLVRVVFGLLFAGISCFVVDYILNQEFFMNNLALTVGSSYIPFSVSFLTFVIGMVMLFYFLIVDGKNIFQQSGLRKTILLKNSDQNQYILSHFVIFSGIYFVLSIIVFLYFFFGIHEVMMSGGEASSSLIVNFCLLLVFGYLLSSCVVLLCLALYSNRIYGPVYGFGRYMNSLTAQGKAEVVFKTRKKDHFKELETLAEYIRTRIVKKL